MRNFFSSALLIALVGLAAWGQADANKGQIFGTVLDPKGAAVPGAKIKVKNPATGLTRELTSSNDGQYRILQLDPGTYEVEAQASGFATTALTGVVLNVGTAINLDIKLPVEGTTQTIEVVETMISTAVPAPTTVISATVIRDLPINGRRFQDFATLTPTVQVEPQRQQLSFAGQRGINANIMVDGADYNQPFFGGIRGGERSNFNFTLPQSAVQEFQAVATGYAAEYGRSTGGVLNVITKSGTNEWHGDAFYQNRNRSLSADNPIFLVQPSESLQQWGGSAGGPIAKDRFFLFGAYEQQKSDTPRQVLFPQLSNATPGPATNEALQFFRSQEVPFTQDNRNVATTARADYMFADGSRLTTRYNFHDSNENNAVSVGGALNPFTNSAVSNEGTEKGRSHFGTMQWTKIFGPSTVNDLKFSGSYEERPRLANSSIPTVSAGVIGTYGARSFLPTIQNDTRYQISDNLSFTRGGHTLKLGFDFNKLDAYQTFGFNQFGAFSIAGSNVNTILDIMGTGGSIANRFDGRDVTYNRQIGNLLAEYGVTQFAFFVQDSWRVRRNLTLDLGLRYEGQWNPEPDATNTSLANKVKTVFPVGVAPDPGRIPDNLAQWMPRGGFAWTPFDTARRTVIRGHAGIFYATTPMLLFSDATANFRSTPNNVSLQLAPTATMTVYEQLRAAGVDLNTFTLDRFPVIPVETVQRASAIALGGTARDPFLGASVTLMAPNYENPRSFQTGLGIDTEIMPNWLAGIQFNYVNTVHLHRNRDINLPFPTVRPNDGSLRPNFGLRSGAARWVRDLGAVTIRESSARQMYRAMTFQTQYRGKKFQTGVFYTLAQNFSDDDSERDAGGVNFDNTFNFRPEYNYSNLDARHQFASYATYTLPWGFELSGLYRGRSGLPLNPRVGADINEDLSAATVDRPYSAPGQPMKRNSFRNRSFNTVDLRLLKSFRLGERSRIQLSAEMFNLFNFDNVIYGANAQIYGAGIGTNGQPLPVDARFMRLRTADGLYDRNNQQVGNPFQAQFGIRFFF